MMRNLISKSLIISALTTYSVAFACSPPPPHPELLLVGNKGEDSVSFIDLQNGEEITRPKVKGSAPHEIAVSPSGYFAAVVNYGGNSIDVFEVPFKLITTTISLGENKNPHGLLFLSDERMIATTEGGDSIVVLSPNHDFSQFGPGPCPVYNWTVESISTGQKGTHMVAVSPDETIAYTANMQSASVSRIDLTTKSVLSAPAGREVEGIAVARNGKEVWASVRGENKVIVFDAETLEPMDDISVGKFPLRLAISPDGRKAVTSNLMDGSLTVMDIETREIERTIEVSGQPVSAQVTILFSDDGSKIYVAETGTDTIAEVDFASGEVLRRLPAGRQGDGLAIVSARP